MWQLSKTEVFSICLVAIVLELFTAALLLANKGWILQYYLSAGDRNSWRGRRKMAEFSPSNTGNVNYPKELLLIRDCACPTVS